MAVPDQTPYNSYTANGVTTIFPYEFYLINAGDLTVSLDGEVVSTGFNVTGIDNVNGGEVTFLTPPANGVIVMLERVVAPVRLTEYQDNGDLLADTVNLDFDRLWMAIKQSFVSLGFALLRPVSGGPFNAKGRRIASLADPVNDQDAATKGYANTLDKKTNQHIETLNNATNNRALRVPEAVISPIPNAATRAGKLLSFDALGAPIAALPPTGTAADVLTELAKSDGATKIGSQQPDGKSETVQQALSAIRKAVENKLDIGGAVNTLVSRGRVPALSGHNQGTAGIQMYEAYNNGYPTPYGNVIHLKGASTGGEGELLIGWSGTSISGAHAPVYIRSRRDVGNAPWSAWAQVFTANEIQAYTEMELDRRYQPKGQSYTKAESDARYVRDVQRGAVSAIYTPESTSTDAPKGCVMVGVTLSGDGSSGTHVYQVRYCPLQIYINGAWRTISDISDSK